jgi:hypothetical protein
MSRLAEDLWQKLETSQALSAGGLKKWGGRITDVDTWTAV